MIIYLTTMWSTTIIRGFASCVLGFLLWFMMRTHYDHSLAINIPIRIDQSYASQIILPETIHVALTGPWKNLCRFIHQKPHLIINRGPLKRGLQELKITPEQIQLPSELHFDYYPTILVFVNPSR